MKWLNSYRIKLMLCGVIAVIVLSATNARGEGFLDDFDRPDGEVGNGWLIWKEGGIESRIVDNEVLIAGQQRGDWKRSGIYRLVEGETRFSFDFKADDNFNVHIELYDYENKRGVDFYAWLGGTFSCGYGSTIKSIGSTVITDQYYNLVVEKEGAEFTLTLNGQVIGTVTDEDFPYIGNIIHIDEVFIAADAAAGTVGSLHIDNVEIGQAPIIPIFDFNGDGIINSADMCVMIDHWGEDYSLCDIAPALFGDGIVDIEDLKVLAEHLFEEVNDPTLVAHWPVDETEGMFAADSVGDNDAVVVGAVWQPGSGQINGALQLNGIDGCAITGPVLNPADGPFSIIAWVKGGAPGQIVVSQQGAANWLAVGAEGNLMTELKSSDQFSEPLLSETGITDGQWHRIGLVWDGSNRTLYVDGVVVAEDTLDGLEDSENSLYLGTGKAMEPGTFFSGLIDDVRIYKRAVSP